MDKILFLDIDGVLNSDKYYEIYRKSDIDPDTIELINSLDISDLKIVISSSYGEDGVNLLKDVLKFPIIGYIKHYSINYDWICRGNDIIKWLLDNGYYASVHSSNEPDVKYCILDDDDDILFSQKNLFVQTDRKIGLTEKDINKIKNILK